jgi:hypothetical protein
LWYGPCRPEAGNGYSSNVKPGTAREQNEIPA